MAFPSSLEQMETTSTLCSLDKQKVSRCRCLMCLDLSLVLKQRPDEAQEVTKRRRRRKILPVHSGIHSK
ncbi:hypothetical protein Q8A67_021207 [Cirrhinus molitorella]|uniref:Uncharacterized protein n=1 Tax=Cirrhinus molitorella TaxID=172907 RepID=A0AA88P9B7_9TELE|nr:hypothetical protein Q8A67_021207 [Cirrhinus molitorella]